jgi:hypothetical protein
MKGEMSDDMEAEYHRGYDEGFRASHHQG